MQAGGTERLEQLDCLRGPPGVSEARLIDKADRQHSRELQVAPGC